MEDARGEGAYERGTTCVGLARLGSDDQRIVVGSMESLLCQDFGPPLHCLIIAGQVHVTEEEMLAFYRGGAEQQQEATGAPS